MEESSLFGIAVNYRLSSEREAIIHEIDKYVTTQRESRQPTQEQSNNNASLDQIYEVDDVLARATKRKECSGKEAYLV